MSCYVCLEECNEKSPCECEHLVHEECLYQTCKSQHIVHCTICKGHLEGYVFRNTGSSKNNDYNIIDSESDSDSDEDILTNRIYCLEISKLTYKIFYLFWWGFLSTVVGTLWSGIFCSGNVCDSMGIGLIFGIATILEFMIVFGCSKKYIGGEIRYSRS